MRLALSMLLACGACRSCDGASSPVDSGTPDSATTSTGRTSTGTTGTATTTGNTTTDCALHEVEPNDAATQAQSLPLERWLCGSFLGGYDPEHATVEVAEGWLRVEVRAQADGSLADPRLWLQGPEGAVLWGFDGVDSTDPRLVFPATAGLWLVQVSDEYAGEGAAFTWRLMASVAKAPGSWDVEEVEGSDTHLQPGQVGFGHHDAPGDVDTWLVQAPEQRGELVLRVVAMAEGSPFDGCITAWGPAGDERGSRCHGEWTSDRDPVLVVSHDAGELLTAQVHPPPELEPSDQPGGDAWWYLFTAE